ncbi:MAG: rhomboid family intramembrane serine protease [Acidobacteriota bacterium]|nr:rhomboid family intramembrane serine protease [Acidobacteriota bacterium]
MVQQSSGIAFPRFRGAVRAVVLASAAIYVATLLALSFAPPLGQAIIALGSLSPEGIRHGWLWQFFTYAFIYVDPLQFVFTMMGIYFIGNAVEERIGSRRFLKLYLFSAIGSGMLGFLLSLTGVVAQGPAFTSGVAANALLMVFYLLYRDAPILLFPIPIPIPVKYMVIFTAAIEGAYLLLSHFGLFYFVLLFGLGTGYLWHRMASRRSLGVVVKEPWYNLRGAYYRWKRRRAAKQFEVYMREHGGGTYVDPLAEDHDPRDKSPQKKNGESREPWIH